MNLPNFCTLLRVIALVPLLLLLLADEFLYAFGVFMLASSLDWLDGWIARRFNQTSVIGATFDHLADKLLVGSTMVTLVYVQPSLFALFGALSVVARDLLMGGMREYWLNTGAKHRSAVSFFGKLKSAIQMLSICTVLLVLGLAGDSMIWFVDLCYLLIITVTLLSLIDYLLPVKHAD